MSFRSTTPITGGATRGRPRSKARWGLCLLGLAVWVACLTTVRETTADPVKLDKPVRVVTTKSDKTKLTGRVSSYDEQGFELKDDKDAAVTVSWSDLPAKSVMDVYAALLPKGTAQDWVSAGRVMYHLSDGKDFGERAFARALRLDPKIKDKIEDAKKAPAVAAAAPVGGPKGAGTGDGELLGRPGETASKEDVLKHLWGKLSDEEQAKAVKELKSFAGSTRKGKSEALKLYETKYFLFYSDLKPEEAKNWSGLLDKMYARLSVDFAVPKDTNIWLGKALIIVFSKSDDYMSFERESHETDAKGTAGMCHSFGNGFVHIAFYRQPEDLEFAHVLVHESVHGFIHRYRSHVFIPSWANEGLAEVIAADLVPQKGRQTDRRLSAKDSMRSHGGMGSDFFDVAHIAGWQYPVAENLCQFMIDSNKKGYVAFINGVKDGQSIDDSLKKNYGTTKERLSAAFLASMGVQPK